MSQSYPPQSFAPQTIGALPLATAVNAYYGNARANLAPPANARFIVLMADRGNFRIRQGNQVAMPPEFPAAAVTDGSNGIYLPETNQVVLPVNAVGGFTVIGYSADAVLSYYWY